MALTKQEIKGLLDDQTKTLRAEVRQVKAEVRQGFQEQNKFMNSLFADQNELIKNTYASKEELEELRNEMYELREKVEALQKQFA
jgi:multidrug resistance efflux pump